MARRIFVILLSSCFSVSRGADADPPSRLSDPGNPPGPDTVTEDVLIPTDVLSCSDSIYAVGSDGYWSYSQIARAFFEFSVKPWNWQSTKLSDHVGDCVAALAIVAGECNPGTTPTKGCDAASTGPSGVFQTDFMRTAGPGQKVLPVIGSGPMSLCISAYGAGYMVAAFPAAANKTSTLEGSSFFTCRDSMATVNEYKCDDPQASSGTTYTNFIGPFCHKARDSRWSPCNGGGSGSCCAMWNGGGNSYQVPFPDYYYEKAQEAGGADFAGICQSAASSLETASVNIV